MNLRLSLTAGAAMAGTLLARPAAAHERTSFDAQVDQALAGGRAGQFVQVRTSDRPAERPMARTPARRSKSSTVSGRLTRAKPEMTELLRSRATRAWGATSHPTPSATFPWLGRGTASCPSPFWARCRSRPGSFFSPGAASEPRPPSARSRELLVPGVGQWVQELGRAPVLDDHAAARPVRTVARLVRQEEG